VLPAEEIPENFNVGFAFNTISVSPPHYLSWLKSELLGKGVQFIRKTIQSLGELHTLTGSNGIVINASSLG
jgi:D-amino-acid oxidase